MSEHLNELLSAWLDNELSPEERAHADDHLAACEQCRADLDGLRRVVRRAASLDDRPPEKDLWSGIASRIATPATTDVVPLESRRRRVAFTIPQLAAAGLALMLVSASAVTLLTKHESAAAPIAQLKPDTSKVRTVLNPADEITASYDVTIRDLQRALDSRRGQLDTATVRLVEQSLHLIDAAIRQAREALARDPNNLYLNGHLQRAYDRKLDLLRQVVTLPVAS